MSETTAIEWCDSTWNGWIGCTRVSRACDDCYAARSTPARAMGLSWGPGEPRHRTAEENWALPIRWNAQAVQFMAENGRRRRVFALSLGDWLDNEVPIEWLCDMLQLVRSTRALDWLLLSKRIGAWRKRMQSAQAAAAMRGVDARWRDLAMWIGAWLDGSAPANVWIGATVVDQTEADRDVPKLLATPAAVRFLSIEPMLGPVDLRRLRTPKCVECGDGWHFDALTGRYYVGEAEDLDVVGRYRQLHWVICGGESGPQARPMHPAWTRSLRDQCEAALVPFFFKQWGEWAPRELVEDTRTDPAGSVIYRSDHDMSYRREGKKGSGRLLDGQLHDGVPVLEE